MTFFFDANISKYVANVLSIMQSRLNKKEKTNHQVKSIPEAYRADITDPELFQQLPSDSVLITLDISQQRKWHERIKIEEEDLSIIYIRSSRNLNYWQMF